MPKEYINPGDLFPSLEYGFSQAVTSSGGKLVFVSGQVGWDEEERIVGPDDLGAQTRQALENLRRAMEAAGGSLEDVVSLRIYIRADQLGKTKPVSVGLKEFFPEDRAPASTWIGVSGLANGEFLIEIEAIGVVEDSAAGK